MHRSYIITALTLTVILLPFSAQAARSTPVTVVNDKAAPVPVTGAVDANVVGIPGVTIENGPLEAVPVTIETYPREAVFNETVTLIPVGSTSVNAGIIYTVPSDKIFVLQHVGITKDSSGADIDYAWLEDRLSFIPQISSSESESVINQQVTQYFQPNEQIRAGARLTAASTSLVNFFLTLSGYLVPVGSPSLAP